MQAPNESHTGNQLKPGHQLAVPPPRYVLTSSPEGLGAHELTQLCAYALYCTNFVQFGLSLCDAWHAFAEGSILLAQLYC